MQRIVLKICGGVFIGVWEGEFLVVCFDDGKDDSGLLMILDFVLMY